MRDRCLIVLAVAVASLSLLLALTSLWSLVSARDVSAMFFLKLAVNVIIIGAAVVAVFRSQAFIALAVVFSALTAYNVYQGSAGHPDCGCFAMAMSPWHTAVVDAVVACLCASLSPSTISWRVAVARCAAFMLAASATVGALGWYQDAPDRSHSKGAADLLPAGMPDSFAVLVYRSDCPKCLQVVTRFRAWSEERQAPILVADLASSSVSLLPTGQMLASTPASETVRALAQLPVPSLVRVADRRVISVEDAFAIQQW